MSSYIYIYIYILIYKISIYLYLAEPLFSYKEVHAFRRTDICSTHNVSSAYKHKLDMSTRADVDAQVYLQTFYQFTVKYINVRQLQYLEKHQLIFPF